MADQWMRCNLAAAAFPFATQLWGRSIIVPQYDQNFDKTINVASTQNDADKDKGIPQAFYMHNCMPTSQGYQAIAYLTALAPYVGKTDFDAAFILTTPNLANILFVPAAGKNYIYDANVGSWASVSPFAAGTVAENVQVTTAFIQGQTYIFYEGYNCFTYNTTTHLLDTVVLAGLTLANTIGICESNGYLIAYSTTAVAWSSATTPTDFVPSLITGAGGGSISDAKGKIVCCLPISGGFLIYCEQNVVSAKYSGNIRFPFIFKEITGSGGLSSPEMVSWTANLAEHYAWTTQGFQRLDMNSAIFVTPELTDFLGNKFYEDFDEATLIFSTTYLTAQLNIKVTVCEDRYIVISYGVSRPSFSYALIYDIALKRWGKLKITHRDCFSWVKPSLYGPVTYGQLISTLYGDLADTTYGQLNNMLPVPGSPKGSIAFLQKDGTVQTVDFSQAQTSADGVLIIGKFQYQRNYFMIHEMTDVENVQPSGAFSMYVIPSMDGKTLDPAVTTYAFPALPFSRKFAKRVVAQNISLLFTGSFNLTSLMLNFHNAGKR